MNSLITAEGIITDTKLKQKLEHKCAGLSFRNIYEFLKLPLWP